MNPKRRSVRPTVRPSVYAGIDAGGSHSEAVIVDREGEVIARVRGAATVLRPDNVRPVSTAILALLAKAKKLIATSNIAALVVGIAGAGRAAERNSLETALRKRRVTPLVRIVGDGEAALESAFPERPGLLLVAGTGSIAYARDRTGTVRRVGGLGWQLGDEGSGWALGRAALGAAGRAADGRGPATILLEMVHRATATSDLESLVRWSQLADREKVAALAHVACDAANAGDPLARELVEQTAHDLSLHTVALLKRIAPDVPESVLLAGGLLTADSPVRSRLVAALGRLTPPLSVADRTIDPALGAASLALKL